MYSLLKKVNQILNKEIKRITSNNAEKGTEKTVFLKKKYRNYYFYFFYILGQENHFIQDSSIFLYFKVCISIKVNIYDLNSL